MDSALTCRMCGAAHGGADRPDLSTVRSNVRRFRDERFAVWRCRQCRSIHARDEVDLAHYYEDYPFHHAKHSALARLFLNRILQRLRRAGLVPSHTLLDYGCGSGLFVEHLRSKGYTRAEGYDAFSKTFADPAVLERQYDCILAQDVIEHVADPRELLRTLGRLTKPRAVLAIGTPNASAINLSAPDGCIHALHQPYHRTILSKDALLTAGRTLGWRLERYYATAYANTLIPFINARMWFRYTRSLDNTMDLAFEPIKLSPKLLSPGTVFDALLGGFFCPELDIMAIFRTP